MSVYCGGEVRAEGAVGFEIVLSKFRSVDAASVSKRTLLEK